jgi:hypothetical protein
LSTEAPLQRRGDGSLPAVTISTRLAADLGAEIGDLLYITDRRAWLGGLRSAHAVVGQLQPGDERTITLDQHTYSTTVAPGRKNEPLRIERLY